MTAPTTTAPNYNLGPVLPHVRRAAELVGPMVGLTRILGWRATARDMAGHPAGRALDYMCTPEQGDRIVGIYQANWEALAAEYLIWEQRSWNPRDGWEDMEDRGSPTQNHYDHVHAQHKILPGSGRLAAGSVLIGASTTASGQVTDNANWAADVAGIALKAVVFIAAGALVVVGLNRTVSTGKEPTT